MKLNAKKYDLCLASACMSVQEFAEKSGVSQITLRRIKTGKQEARPQTVGKIARALNVRVEDLIEEGEE